MANEHLAEITWSEALVRRGLPNFDGTIDPAWIEGARPGKDEGWSLNCTFAAPPSQQGNPSKARVRFLMDEAPHDYLRPGAQLKLFERSTSEYAAVLILD